VGHFSFEERLKGTFAVSVLRRSESGVLLEEKVDRCGFVLWCLACLQEGILLVAVVHVVRHFDGEKLYWNDLLPTRRFFSWFLGSDGPLRGRGVALSVI